MVERHDRERIVGHLTPARSPDKTMGIFSRLFGGASAADRVSIRLDEPDPWEVTGTRDVERFLRTLPLLTPAGAFVYFEGTGEPHVAEYLRSISVPAPVHVACGTIWPRPDRYHVPIDVDTMEALAHFLERSPAGFFCAHCHVHDGASIVLEWHDAFGTDPMLLSSRFGEDTVASFAASLGTSYERASVP
jgi:hypothetical protein